MRRWPRLLRQLASSFTFAKASWTQALPDWIDADVCAFEAIGGVSELVVPDNAKIAIVKARFYEPEVNRTIGPTPR
jgi:transposase